MKLKLVGRLFLECLIGVLLFLGSTSAYAQKTGDRWIYTTVTGDGDRVYLENTYKELSNGNKVIWAKTTRRDGPNELVLWEYDCGKGKQRALEYAAYNSGGKIIDSGAFSSYDWKTPVPDSVGEVLFEAVCKEGKRDAPPEQPVEQRPPETRKTIINLPPPGFVKQPSENRPSEMRPPQQAQSPQLPLGALPAQEEASERYPPNTRKSSTERNDIGVDYAIVTAKRANLRENADLNSTVLLEIPNGALLVLLNTAPDGLWHNVLHVKSNQEGWIHRNAVATYYTKNPKPKLTIQGRDTGGFKNPSVEVKNDSEKTLTLKMGETRHVFYSQEAKTIQLTPGKYSFYASAPGVIPDFGEENFQAGHVYTWRFYIVTTRSRR